MEEGKNLIHLIASVLSGQATEEDLERIRPKPTYRNYSEIASKVGAEVTQGQKVLEDSSPAKNQNGPLVVEEPSSSSKTVYR